MQSLRKNYLRELFGRIGKMSFEEAMLMAVVVLVAWKVINDTGKGSGSFNQFNSESEVDYPKRTPSL